MDKTREKNQMSIYSIWHRYRGLLFAALGIFLSAACMKAGSAEKALAYQAYLTDEADLFSDAEEAELFQTAGALSEAHELDVALVTLSDLPSPADEDDDALRNFTRSYYQEAGINSKGILMLVAYDGGDLRRTWFYPGEDIVDAFTASGQQYMWRTVKPYFSDLKFYEGYKDFLTRADDFLVHYEDGTPYSRANHNIPKPAVNYLYCLAGAVIVGLILAFCVVYLGYYKGQLKTVRRENRASNYMKPGSRHITNARDIFLYTTVSQTERPDNDSGSSSSDSGSGGSGGSF